MDELCPATYVAHILEVQVSSTHTSGHFVVVVVAAWGWHLSRGKQTALTSTRHSRTHEEGEGKVFYLLPVRSAEKPRVWVQNPAVTNSCNLVGLNRRKRSLFFQTGLLLTRQDLLGVATATFLFLPPCSGPLSALEHLTPGQDLPHVLVYNTEKKVLVAQARW